MNPNPLEDHLKGSLWGLFVGDALGAPYEFIGRGNYQASEKYQKGGSHNLEAGQWTDDSSMALCVMESLLEKNQIDLKSIMEKFCDWYYDGHLSSTGYCFDIGFTTKYAIRTFKKEGKLEALTEDQYSGNGGIMRLAPIPVWLNNRMTLQDTIQKSLQVSSLTHASQKCQAGALYMSAILYLLFKRDHGYKTSKETLLLLARTALISFRYSEDIIKVIDQILKNLSEYSYDQVKSSGYVIHTLEAALWAFVKTDNFKAGLMVVMNMGDDVDTVGAVYGQIAGAYYGISGIDSYYLENIFQREKLEKMVNTFVEKSLSEN